MKIRGIDGMLIKDVQDEVMNGAKFVIYTYCISILVMTFKRGTDIYFVKNNESTVAKGLPWTLLTFLLGWWGIPWGFIYTPMALYDNLSGGKDVTEQVMNFIYSQSGGPIFDYQKEVTPEEEKELDSLKGGIENK